MGSSKSSRACDPTSYLAAGAIVMLTHMPALPGKNDSTAVEQQTCVEHISLSAQLPIIPPDETPGLLGVRDLSDDEARQYRQDAALLRAIVPLSPYVRAADAVEALSELVDQLADASDDGTLTRRGQRHVERALAIVARTFDELPKELQASLRDRLGAAGDEARRLSEEHARLAALPSYSLACALDSVPVEHLRVAPDDEASELVLRAEGVVLWSLAADAPLPTTPLGLVAIAERGLLDAERLVARWLLEHADVIREASLRMATLAAEVIEGAPAVVAFHIRRRSEEEEPEVLGMTHDAVPLEELRTLQVALQRAKRRLESEPREPALRGAPGLYPEQILTAVAERNREMLGQPVDEPADDIEEDDPGAGDDAGDSDQDADEIDEQPGAPPIDLATVIAHAELGTMALEQAWSRALADEDTEELLARWFSTIEAIRAEVFAADQKRPENDRYLEVPPTEAEIAGVVLAPGSNRMSHQARVAQMLTMIEFIDAIRSLDQPTQRLVDQPGGRYAQWVSSGAFALARDQLRALSGLLDAETGPPTTDEDAERAFHLAANASRRGDPEAAVLHLARGLLLRSARTDDPHTTAVLELIKGAAARLAHGEQLDRGAITLLAHAGIEYIGSGEGDEGSE